MDSAVKRKVTVKVNYHNDASSASLNPHQPYGSRPPSPLKYSSSEQSSLSPPNVIRPKSKINSSARKAPSSSTIRSNTSTTPRALSPARPQLPSRNGALSPSGSQGKPRAPLRATVRPQTSHSVLGISESRQRSLTATSSGSDVPHSNVEARRRSSVSLQKSMSFSSLQRAATPPGAASSVASSSDLLSPQDSSSLLSVGGKVKAKVSDISKAGDTLLPSSPFATVHATHSRTRAPSISSQFSSTPSSPAPSQTFYPITTATAAANPHRFATTRASPPPPSHHQYQPFIAHDDSHVNYSRPNGFPIAKVDPATIPTPNSPPTSALSFSSRSSLSRSSASFTADNSSDYRHGSPTMVHDLLTPDSHAPSSSSNLRQNIENLVRYQTSEFREGTSSGDSGHDQDTDGESDGQARKVKAEAKSIRKIADLEITNRSLLAINASLEVTKHQQAKEIRELRRKLRESRLILPPRAYRAVQSSLDHDDTAEEEEEEEEEDLAETAEVSGDEVYKRIKLMVEGLLDSGRRALEAKKADFGRGGKSGTKVLSAEEVRNWRDSTGNVAMDDDEAQLKALEDDFESRRESEGSVPISPSQVAVPDDGALDSEGEVEMMALATTSATTDLAPPPIHVTHSP